MNDSLRDGVGQPATHEAHLAQYARPDRGVVDPVVGTNIWRGEDGWLVSYTTERLTGGPHKGQYAALAYMPAGEGSRSGWPERWERAYFRSFAKRKAARQRALALYYQHSPQAAERDGWDRSDDWAGADT